MRCEQVTPYLPGYAGGDLRPDTTRIVAEHVAGCSSCRAEADRHERVHGALGALSTSEVEPPAYLLDAILESTGKAPRRILPVVPPNLPQDVLRLVQENRETIASAGAAAIVAAGAAYAVWRAVRKPRPGASPATS